MGQAAREAAPWVARLARAGYAARAVLYFTIGILAVKVALGHSDAKSLDAHGAMRAIGREPFGALVLALVAIGLVGHAVWRFVQAALDPEHEAREGKSRWRRVGWAATGALYTSFAVYAVGLLTGAAQGGGDATKSWSARLMAWPGGAWIVGAAGIGVAAFGAYQMYRAVKARLDAQLDLGRLAPTTRAWVIAVARVGLGARGVVFGVIGAFLVIAAARTDPDRAKGLDAALRTVEGWTMGGVLLGAIALGLLAYAAYEVVEVAYRRIRAA